MQKIYIREDRAIKTNKSYCVNRDVICTLPKSGSHNLWRPSVLAYKKIQGNAKKTKRKY